MSEQLLLSVITPVHKTSAPFLAETFDTLRTQTYLRWEWMLIENNGGKVPDAIRKDPRVRVLQAPDHGSVGKYKRQACLESNGDVFVELDADDLLHEDALKEIAEAVLKGGDFIYSDFAEFRDRTWEKEWDRYPYGAAYGWKSYPVTFKGHDLIAMVAPEATAQNIRLVDWAPNHVRAWTRASYMDVGGHNPDMAVADDHELVVRYYLAQKKFFHIPRCLYFYRVHSTNTVSTRNEEIRNGTWSVYNKYLFALAERWTMDRGLKAVDLCGGVDPIPGYLALDRRLDPGVHGIACDLNERWPLEDSSVGIIRANDAVEHLKDPIFTMNEAWRVLAPGGWLMIDVPSSNGPGAFCDPTHVSFWNKLSFRYYTNDYFRSRYIPAFRGAFQAARVIEWHPSEDHRRDNLLYVQAHLIALKDGYTPMGDVNIRPHDSSQIQST